MGSKLLVLAGIKAGELVLRSMWPLVCLSILAALGSCSASGDHGSKSAQTPAKEQPEKADTSSSDTAQAPGTVQVQADMQRSLRLKIEPLVLASTPRELRGYGRVLDPAPLVADVSEWASARAASAASAQEFERLKSLEKQNTASTRAVQAAEAAAVRDRLLVQSMHDRIALSWGATLAGRPDVVQLMGALVSQDRVIVRVDLPAGEGSEAQPQRARVTALAGPQNTVTAEFVGLAPTTDAQLQGRGFLFMTRDNPLRLTPGAAVTAVLELGGTPIQGVLVPESAVVRHEASTWIYVQRDPITFVRTPVSLASPVPGGWLITQRLAAADRIVTHGAQVLLSEELKPETRLPD
jgi:hypothetical protein